MRVVFISPDFPENFYPFCTELAARGHQVLGLSATPYEHLRPELRTSLTEYYRVDKLDNIDSLRGAMRHFIGRWGPIDAIESLNEHWLETEAQLRAEFDVPGWKPPDMAPIKRKSVMKQHFVDAGLDVAPGRVLRSPGGPRPVRRRGRLPCRGQARHRGRRRADLQDRGARRCRALLGNQARGGLLRRGLRDRPDHHLRRPDRQPGRSRAGHQHGVLRRGHGDGQRRHRHLLLGRPRGRPGPIRSGPAGRPPVRRAPAVLPLRVLPSPRRRTDRPRGEHATARATCASTWPTTPTTCRCSPSGPRSSPTTG